VGAGFMGWRCGGQHPLRYARHGPPVPSHSGRGFDTLLHCVPPSSERAARLEPLVPSHSGCYACFTPRASRLLPPALECQALSARRYRAPVLQCISACKTGGGIPPPPPSGTRVVALPPGGESRRKVDSALPMPTTGVYNGHAGVAPLRQVDGMRGTRGRFHRNTQFDMVRTDFIGPCRRSAMLIWVLIHLHSTHPCRAISRYRT